MRSRHIARQISGYSLTELLITVAVLLLIAAVVAPRLTHSRVATDEAAVMQELRKLNRAEALYASKHPDQGFSASLSELASDPAVAQDSGMGPELAAGHKSGYLFTYVPGERLNGAIKTYIITAAPEKAGETGQRRFFTDESGEVRYNGSGPADVTSPVIQ